MDCKSAFGAFRSASDEAGKRRAINALIYSGCRRYSQLLLNDFGDQPEEVKLSIIFAMRMIAGPRAEKSLEILMSDPSLSVPVRAALTEIVGDLGMSGCRPILRQQLGHASPEIRFWSCQSLGMLPDADDLPSLEVMLTDLEHGYLDSTVADAARQAIEMIKSKAA
jgi:HEAT repeat protein